eukprot:6076190-Amphidinium_carterae.1
MESRESVLKAVGQRIPRRWDALREVGEVWRSDNEVVLAAVQANGQALEFAAEALRGDREIVLAAVQQCGAALRYATEALNGDREFVLTAVQKNARALEYATEALKADREVVLAAVQKNGLSLRYATEAIMGDREIVLAAVQQEEIALHWVADDLLEDRTFATEAKRQFHLLKLTMLSGRSTVVAASPYSNVKLWNVLSFCRERLGLACDGTTMELWHGPERVPSDVRVRCWPGIQPTGEISEYQLVLTRR